MNKIAEIFKLMRIRHYLKNVIIFAAIFFSGEMLHFSTFIKVLWGFVVFSLISSVVYIINDIFDRNKDRHNPDKAARPIASGSISVSEGIGVAFVCFLIAIILDRIFIKENIALLLCLIYLILNILYSIKLKHIPLVDIVILTSGFLIRLFYGSIVCGQPISNWLYLTVTSGAFYMCIGKRRKELKGSKESRPVLAHYSYDFLNNNMYVFLSLTYVFYALWTMERSEESPLQMITVPYLMIILMKYSLDIEGGYIENPIEVVVKDKILLVLVGIFSVAEFIFIYYLR